MSIIIRQAQPQDAQSVVPLIIDAIGDIANRLTGEQTASKIEEELTVLFKREDNRHSYLNTFVAVEGEQILGTLVYYNGEQAIQMDANLVKWLEEKNAPSITIDKEAHEDEYYIDTVCVAPEARGKGIGTMLIQFAIEQTQERGFTKLSLNVETQKEDARRLYERMGFVITEPWSIIDEPFHHMVKQI
ncbi:GNAT family N-acetyltransferase [Lysinibacillus sp. NPDC097279]|uniref:GNAT family N-acetyltransferase n=1 Tax=unclassified Lysinibacillus TaxID=2636778 RepID=UPI00111C94DA|nr:GNAT family N-acetyltransferase [Lysinibacillus sp. CD3-6]QPQ33587.1 GNAT family N-acetyltransferase [Lysinibacillus sp. JNUCC-52]UED80475.1 GNAT family N-acetyltransferase [Lysinibacillus sp. CD3-6]